MDSTGVKKILDRGKILDKEECYLLYEIGYFGNKVKIWDSYKKIIDSGWKGRVCMRSKIGIDRRRTEYNIPINNLQDKIKRWVEEGHPEGKIAFNESMPDEKLTLQGEVSSMAGGLYLTYTTIKEPMNIALSKEYLISFGLSAKDILIRNFDGPSFENLERLFEKFPDSVVEFSSYNFLVGDLKNNTVFWEVRNY